METSARERQISTQPFAVTKCSAWLVSNESPQISGSKSSYTEICYNIIPHPLSSSPYRQHTKTLGLQKFSFPNIVGSLNNRAGMSAYGQVRSATCGLWAATSPWILQHVNQTFTEITSTITNSNTDILQQKIKFRKYNSECVRQYSVGGRATHYGLDGPRIESGVLGFFCTAPDRPHVLVGFQ